MAVLRVCLGILLLTSMLNAIESSHNRVSGWKTKRAAHYDPWTPPNIMVRTTPNRKPSSMLWQPNQVQIQGPYYIPIWRSPEKPTIYSPSQALYLNPGLIINNKYLPTAGKNTIVPIPTDYKLVEDRPIWGTVDEPATPVTVKPTRKSRFQITHRPLVKPTDSKTTNNAITVVENQPPAPSIGSQPSRCVWAIISCCSASSNTVSYDCFEQLGCNGPFWDNSPCDGGFARPAISTAMNYYQTR
ncbi:uncharacterized protein LOC116167346 [Photinus pyralis]|uniref:Chitin-binding type-2 domain-containing protein n=1 Tax=Photinus pyralis TaxID=7054 RepID=A0A1Y1L7I2_PHOPY|nr:uncharacterized protein LOC116167346 [Photinus pyralis]XP_031338552.1 uncharacterized protein LOC116167346 [Photinus pyralis]XP_031338553.1 uncharacterized protein LOC116167346 [Photinus pyralis]XP_031338554.1 uncharacterized protein LOC116167346 [Photinus pyralis]